LRIWHFIKLLMDKFVLFYLFGPGNPGDERRCCLLSFNFIGLGMDQCCARTSPIPSIIWGRIDVLFLSDMCPLLSLFSPPPSLSLSLTISSFQYLTIILSLALSNYISLSFSTVFFILSGVSLCIAL